MDRQINITDTLSLLKNDLELFSDILIGDPPLQFSSDNLVSPDLKILFCNPVDDLDPSLGIDENDGFFQVS